ncbi:MAG: thioesterase family protein [bacterium]
MQVLHTSTVLAEEIDSLGHMNVRYYMTRMQSANRQLVDSLDLDADIAQHSFLRSVDTYTRFRNEQFEGATLETAGGLLSIEEGGVQSYIEIRNPDTGDVAATFIVTTALIDRKTRETQILPLPAKPGDGPAFINVPAYARPRSLTLGPANTDISLALLQASIPDVDGGGMMSGKRQTRIEKEDVDAQGWLKEDVELMFLPFAKMVLEEGIKPGPPVVTTSDGLRIGWAVMETRTMLFAQPRLGDELSYFSTDLKVEAKSRLSRRWAMNTHTGQLLGMSDTVGVCIDLDARRAIEWPEEIRAQIEKYQQPQLA